MEAAYAVFLMLTTRQDSNDYRSRTNESQRDENNPPETTSLTSNSILIQKCLVHLLNKERACVRGESWARRRRRCIGEQDDEDPAFMEFAFQSRETLN